MTIQNDFMINLHKIYVAKLGFEIAIPGSAVRHSTNYTTGSLATIIVRCKNAIFRVNTVIDYLLFTVYVELDVLFSYTKSPFSHRGIAPDKRGYLQIHENISCGCSLEAPCQGTSNDYPQHFHGKINTFWCCLELCRGAHLHA